MTVPNPPFVPGIPLPPPQRLVLFDMDDTLVRANTAGLYLHSRWQRGLLKRRELLRLVTVQLRYRLDLVDLARLTREAVATLRDQSEAEMQDECRELYAQVVRPRICPTLAALVVAHRAQGDVTAIVTASTPYVARLLQADLGIDGLLCTDLEVSAGHFTGSVVGLPCFGAAKVERALALAAQHGLRLDEAVFYTDSHSDLPLLQAVAYPRIVRPDPRLRAVAWRRKWPVVRT
ncbi:MAG: HAD-IB family hydrolase [Myxococcales bacterium]|nr:HAD-IB family hydrolase [Myxococcales bacterium]